MNAAKISSDHCHDCGAANLADAKACWMCGSPLYIMAQVVGRNAPVRRPRAEAQFPLATILVTITIIAVLLGVYQQWPGVGFLLSVLIVPPLAATCIAALIRRAEGDPLSTGGKWRVFGVTIGITFGILAATALLIVVFVVVCVAVLFAICSGAIGMLI